LELLLKIEIKIRENYVQALKVWEFQLFHTVLENKYSMWQKLELHI
jgi:hypothetical protein